MVTTADKQHLSRQVLMAKPGDLAVAHVQAAGGTTAKEAFEELKQFVARKADYVVIVVRK